MQQTTTYHPQANGMIERLHCKLKDSLRARTTDPYWMDHLPMVLLGIRTAWHEDPDCSRTELVYGSTLRSRENSWNPHHLKSYNFLLHFFAIFKSQCKMLFHHLSNIIPYPNPTSLPLSILLDLSMFALMDTETPFNNYTMGPFGLSLHQTSTSL